MLEILKEKKKQGVDIDWAYSNFTVYFTCGAIVEATLDPHLFGISINQGLSYLYK